MKTLLIGLAFASTQWLNAAWLNTACAAEPGAFAPSEARAPAHPALYSFVDVYRLTVSGVMAGLPPLEGAAEAPIRVATAPSQAAEPRFSIEAVSPPDKWILLLAGFALAGWVAHRRLVHAI
jgi:hypothetical protein